MLVQESLSSTVDNLNNSLFWDRKLSEEEIMPAIRWLVDRQGLPGSYRGLYAPFPTEFLTGIRLFTGERVKTKAATSHILGEEVSQILLKLNPTDEKVRSVMTRANNYFLEFLHNDLDPTAGIFCCGTCSVALWRHLAAGGLDNPEERITNGLIELKRFRTPDGKYRRFPFFYTLLALSEIDLALAKEEITYLAPKLQSCLDRRVCPKTADRYSERKREIMIRLLQRI